MHNFRYYRYIIIIRKSKCIESKNVKYYVNEHNYTIIEGYYNNKSYGLFKNKSSLSLDPTWCIFTLLVGVCISKTIKFEKQGVVCVEFPGCITNEEYSDCLKI